MKNWIAILMVVLFISCQQGAKQQQEKAGAVNAAAMVETTVLISGMHCDMCVASVTKGVAELAGVDSVAVSLSDSSAVVLFNPEKTSVDQIEAAIIKRGYTIKSSM